MGTKMTGEARALLIRQKPKKYVAIKKCKGLFSLAVWSGSLQTFQGIADLWKGADRKQGLSFKGIWTLFLDYYYYYIFFTFIGFFLKLQNVTWSL